MQGYTSREEDIVRERIAKSLGRMSKNCLVHFIYLKRHPLWTSALVDSKEIKRNIQGVTDEGRA